MGMELCAMGGRRARSGVSEGRRTNSGEQLVSWIAGEGGEETRVSGLVSVRFIAYRAPQVSVSEIGTGLVRGRGGTKQTRLGGSFKMQELTRFVYYYHYKLILD